MKLEPIREFCLSLPYATEDIQWEQDLLFRVGGKMFAVYGLESETLSFKCTPEEFEEFDFDGGHHTGALCGSIPLGASKQGRCIATFRNQTADQRFLQYGFRKASKEYEREALEIKT